ncbi:hypothetical protein QUB30_12675 [Microcoleus sp. BROC3]
MGCRTEKPDGLSLKLLANYLQLVRVIKFVVRSQIYSPGRTGCHTSLQPTETVKNQGHEAWWVQN